MTSPSEFGLLLKEKRKAVRLTQGELAEAIHKSGQYISNIEKGKNSAPPQEADIEMLILKLGLSKADSDAFRSKAAADRSRLPQKQMEYLFKHRKLLELIKYGTEHDISDQCWGDLLHRILGGKNNEIE